MSEEEDKEKQKTDKITFVYSRPEDLIPIYVNGVYGGMTPKGELVCNFFIEYRDVPLEEKMRVVEGIPQVDKIQKMERRKQEPNEMVWIRDIRVCLIIPPQEISNMANWMLEHLKKSKIIVER